MYDSAKYMDNFLPMSTEEVRNRGWDELDIILISGDAYIDHPSFGVPLIGRYLESLGYRVGIIAQPDWRNTKDFIKLGRPRLFFGISAGAMDSMLNHYTAHKKPRSDDAYSPGGKSGLRPDRATIVYLNRVKEAYPKVPTVIGGIEASLRRLAHYDYWDNKVRKSILVDSKGDLLIFGMGEKPIEEVARRLSNGEALSNIKDIRGTAVITSSVEGVEGKNYILLPSCEDVIKDKMAYARASRIFHLESNPFNARVLFQRHGNRYVKVNPPSLPLTMEEMDKIYNLPFTKEPHSSYKEKIPALEMVKFSVTIQRGCFGGCTFCSLTEHQGRIIQSRSENSVLKEVEGLKKLKGFTGIVSDLGGPTANMYRLRCKDRNVESKCRRLSCVHPKICKFMDTDHSSQIKLLRKARGMEGVKRVFIASGVRYDLALGSPEYIKELTTYHVGGHLKVAPEHTSKRVLELMKKPEIEAFNKFKNSFDRFNRDCGKEQYIVPYFISSHPGSDLKDMIDLALYLKKNRFRLQQVQDFIPTPMTLATAMYYTGYDPITSKKIYCARTVKEKRLQKALMRYHDPANYYLVKEALIQAGRKDLIGYGKDKLIPPYKQ
ncbi:MAG: YgiQ family radical SAM protein [Nitrospinae bacterium]|nr:YgiQ family radical SAM protein [Nitrospinota bacterium]